jgi:hypothetical protein
MNARIRGARNEGGLPDFPCIDVAAVEEPSPERLYLAAEARRRVT